MPVFAITAPHLTPEQHYELEGLLLDLPGVDAFFNEDGALGTEVSCGVAALPAIVAVVVDWSTRYERRASLVQLTCAGGAICALAGQSPEALVAFLAQCSDDESGLTGLQKRLADDGMHERR